MTIVKINKLFLIDSTNNKGTKNLSLIEIYKRSRFVKTEKRYKWLFYLYAKWINLRIIKLLSYFRIPYNNYKNSYNIIHLKTRHSRFILGTIHSSKDLVLYETRLTENFGKCEKKPIKIFGFKSHLELPNKLNFNTFIGTNIKKINCIVLEGYINYVDKLNKINTRTFNYKIMNKYVHEYRKNSFWAAFNIIIPDEIRSFSKNINIYVNKYSVNHTKNMKGSSIKNQLFVNKINYNLGKKKTPKLIIVLSFDGISNFDLSLNNSDNLFPALTSFSKNSLSFSNAFASSSTTGSTAASFTTGLGLSRHMIYDYEKNTNQGDLQIISPRITTLPEILSNNG